MATYRLTTSFYDEPSISEDFDNADDALDAWQDADWAYAHAPSDVCGDVRSIALRDPSGRVMRSHGYL